MRHLGIGNPACSIEPEISHVAYTVMFLLCCARKGKAASLLSDFVPSSVLHTRNAWQLAGFGLRASWGVKRRPSSLICVQHPRLCVWLPTSDASRPNEVEVATIYLSYVTYTKSSNTSAGIRSYDQSKQSIIFWKGHSGEKFHMLNSLSDSYQSCTMLLRANSIAN